MRRLDFQVDTELLSFTNDQFGQWKYLNEFDIEQISWEADLNQNRAEGSVSGPQTEANQHLAALNDYQPVEESNQAKPKASFGVLWALMRSWSGIADLAGPQLPETVRRGREQEK
jgi:hypothetical protein